MISYTLSFSSSLVLKRKYNNKRRRIGAGRRKIKGEAKARLRSLARIFSGSMSRSAWEKGLSGLLWTVLKPKHPETFAPHKIRTQLLFQSAAFWNVPGSCCSDLTHLNISLSAFCVLPAKSFSSSFKRGEGYCRLRYCRLELRDRELFV